MRSRSVPAEQCMCCGAGSSDIFAVSEKNCSKIWVWFKNVFFWKAQLSRHFFIEIPFPQRFEWNYSLKINSFASSIEIFSSWEKHPSPSKVVTLWYSSCSSFVFSMGSASCHAMLRHCHCLRRLACPCHDTLSLSWQLQLSLELLQDFVALCYSWVCSKCIHVPLLMCGHGILCEPGSRDALPQHISCSPQATFWVANPFLSRAGDVWLPVLWWKGVVQVSLPMVGLCFIEVFGDLSSWQCNLLYTSFLLQKNHPKKTITGHHRKLCLTAPPPPRHLRLHGLMALLYCVSSPPS